MQCGACRHDFCWVCLGDWKAHGSEYYECSRYKEDPNLANDSQHAQVFENPMFGNNFTVFLYHIVTKMLINQIFMGSRLVKR